MRGGRLALVATLLVATSACAAPQGTSTLTAASSQSAVMSSVVLDQTSNSIAIGEGAVWVRTLDDHILRIDPDSATVIATIKVGGGMYGNVAVGAGAVWVTGFDTNTVYRIDPATNEVSAEIEVGTNPEGIAVTPDAVWIANHRGGSLSRIDPATNTVVDTIVVGPKGPSGPKNIAVIGGDPWTPVPNSDMLVRVDPERHEAASQTFFSQLEGMFASDETVFAITGSEVAPVDVETEQVGSLFTPQFLPSEFGDSAFWAVADGKLWRLDEGSLEPMQSWHVSDSPDAYAEVAIGDGQVWLLFIDDDVVMQVDPS